MNLFVDGDHYNEFLQVEAQFSNVGESHMNVYWTEFA